MHEGVDLLLRNTPVWLLAVVATVVASVGYYSYWTSCPAHLRHLPAVPAYKTIWLVLKRATSDERLAVFRPYAEQHEMMRVFINSHWYVFMNRPHLVKQVFLEYRSVGKFNLGMLNPSSLRARSKDAITFTSANDGSWQRHRQVSTPVFRRGWDTTVFGECAKEAMKIIRQQRVENGKGAIVPVNDLMLRLGLDSLGKALLGHDFRAIADPSGRFLVEFNEVMESFSDIRFNMFPVLDRLGLRNSMHKRFEWLNDQMMDIVAKKRDELLQLQAEGTLSVSLNDDKLDLLKTMVFINEKGDENGQILLNDNELRATTFAFLRAGRDTTGHTLSGIMFLLAANPGIQDKLRAEVQSVMGIESKDIIPTMPELKQMPYIEAVIKEALRMYNPTHETANRILIEDMVFNGTHLPKGTLIGIPTRFIHTADESWPDADEFRPDRFLNGNKEAVPWSWIPFGGGARMCIGQGMALVELQVVLAMLVRRFKWHLPPGVTKPQTSNMNLVFISNANFIFEDI
ncbi:cytochrome P450 [Ramicandelaber brevisporus]|nr:cytochrome P450 [Ramicandelaber brevisporus]